MSRTRSKGFKFEFEKSRRGSLVRVEFVVVFAKENVVGTGAVGIADCFTRRVSKSNHETECFVVREVIFVHEGAGGCVGK